MEFLQNLSELVLSYVKLTTFDTVILEQYNDLFDSILVLSISELIEKREKLIKKESVHARRYQELLTLCDGADEGRWILDLCLTAILYPRFQSFADEYWDGITLETATNFCEEVSNYQLLKQVQQHIARILICKEDAGLFLRYPFFADTRLLDYFLDNMTIASALSSVGTELFYGTENLSNTYINTQIQTELEYILKKSENQCVQIAGLSGCGKQFLLKKACQKVEKQMLFFDLDRFMENKKYEISQYVWMIQRESLLLKCNICFYHIKDNIQNIFIKQFLRPLLEKNINVYICTNLDTELIPIIDTHIYKIVIPIYNRNERIALWEGFTEEYGIRSKVDCTTAGCKFKLSAKEIKKSVERIYKNKNINIASESEISHICEEVLLKPTCGSIKRIHTQYTLNDLKLLPEQKQILYNICSHVWYRHKVYDEWNMESRYAYGKNVSALFVGPPGTGKTMAVHVLANMLHLPLYQVDLSQVVDKYIGETEKRLEEIFTVSEKNNTILFFDEADSIFGKRSDVNEAKDKYANTEISYILQRIEQYDGIVILATNYRKNMDEAFLRRIRYFLEFSLPNIQTRKELWKSSFSKEIPTVKLNYDYLAEQFELSGGSIKNIVLNAAFLAAEKNRPVEMLDILWSVYNENIKTGKITLNKDFDMYSELMEESHKSILQ